MSEVITSINSAVIIRIIAVITIIIVAHPSLLHCHGFIIYRRAAEVYDGFCHLLDVLVDLLLFPRFVIHNNSRRGQPLGGRGQISRADVQPLLRPPAQIHFTGGQVVRAGGGWQGGASSPEPLAVHETRLSVQGGGCALLSALSPPSERSCHGCRSPGGGHGWECRGRG